MASVDRIEPEPGTIESVELLEDVLELRLPSATWATVAEVLDDLSRAWQGRDRAGWQRAARELQRLTRHGVTIHSAPETAPPPIRQSIVDLLHRLGTEEWRVPGDRASP